MVRGAVGSLSGRTALVTGAARRLGRAIALGLAGEGANCLLHYRSSADEVAATAEECRRLGVGAECLKADLGDPEAVQALGLEAACRGADLFVHNASAFVRLPFFERTVREHRDALERDLRLHVEAPYLLGRLLGEAMVERGFGRIVLIGDWSAEATAYRHYPTYLVSKGAVPTLARVLALELGSRCAQVTVNAVLPGPVLPPEGHDPADQEMARRQTILGRWIGSGEVVRAVLFLLGSDGITGESLRVDGGRAAKAL